MATNISRIFIQVTPARVWSIITEPEFVEQWQFGSKLITNWIPGTPIRFITPWGDQIFEQWGQVKEYNPFDSLSYTLFAPRPGLEDRPENYFLMQYFLQEKGAGTQLEIIQEDKRPGAVQEDVQGIENPVLQALKNLAEGL